MKVVADREERVVPVLSQYKIYLFERILLCCKEINPNKAKNRLGGKNVDKKGKPRLQLKGRIFMQNVTDILNYSRSGKDFFLSIRNSSPTYRVSLLSNG